MRLPVLRGLIERRILVNYRADPEVVQQQLPAPFRPKLFRGHALVGICLIRLRGIRPAFWPAAWGLASENAAHRTAVEWDADSQTHEGVYIRRRDTNSRLNALAGGRLFPGYHSHARFRVQETVGHFEIAMTSDDGQMQLAVAGDVADRLPESSLFASLDEASEFFRAGSVGYSVTPDPGRFQGLEMQCSRWAAVPLAVSAVRSSVFDDRSLFPSGSIEFDHALLMRGIEHEWRSQADLCCARQVAQKRTSPAVSRPV